MFANPQFPRDKIIFPPLRAKLELMKQFMKGLDNERKCLCAKKLIKTNYSPSCQYLEGPATLDLVILMHILKWKIVANTMKL